MCRPPDIVPGPTDASDAGSPGNSWAQEPHAARSGAEWALNEAVEAERASRARMPSTGLSAQEKAMLLQFGQRHQQQDQRLLNQLAAATARATAKAHTPAALATADGTAAAATASQAWNASLLQNYAQKLQGNSAVARAQQSNASLTWLAQQQAAQAGMSLWGGARVAPVAVAPLAPQLVAQGIPWGMIAMDGQVGEQEDDDDELGEKKFKRMMSNRASAKRSRQRRQERLDELEIVSAKLRVENAAVQRRLNEANEQIRRFQEHNDTLSSEVTALRELLERSRKSTSHLEGTAVTNQDSCGATGSTTDKASESSEQPCGKVLGKRSHEQMGECSRLKAGSSLAVKAEVEQGSPATLNSTVVVASVTPSPVNKPASPGGHDTSPQMTSESKSLPSSSGTPGTPLSGQRYPSEELEEGGRGDASLMLDDELFSSFINECFDNKPLQVANNLF